MIKYSIKSAILVLISASAFGQKSSPFILNGKLQNVQDGSIELKTYHNEILDDNSKFITNISNSKFRFAGNIANPTKAFLIFISKSGTKLYSPDFYIDKGTQSFVLDSQTFEHNIRPFLGYSINGLNQEFNHSLQESELHLKVIIDSLHELKSRFARDSSASLASNIEVLQRSVYDKRDDLITNFVKKHNKSYLSLWIIDSCLRERYSKKLENAFSLLLPTLQKGKLGSVVKNSFQDVKSVLPGGYLPALTFVDTSGKESSEIFKAKNKYLFVDLWFSHCGPCLARLPALKEIYEKRQNYGLEIIGVSVRESSLQEWKSTIKKQEIPWSQFFDKKGLFLNTYKIHMFPSNILIDSIGKVVARDLEPLQLLQFLKNSEK